MTDHDQRVAELLGWTWDGEDGCVWRDTDGCWVEKFDWSPSANLAQAMELWAEHRPYARTLEICLGMDNRWIVYSPYVNAQVVPFTDLPRVITQAWVKAKE